MIGYYLSSNNKIYYSSKIQIFSRTKHSLVYTTGVIRPPCKASTPLHETCRSVRTAVPVVVVVVCSSQPVWCAHQKVLG